MKGSRIPFLASQHQHYPQLSSSTSSLTSLQNMTDNHPPVSPPSTPLLYSPTPLTPSPSSSYASISSKSLRPRQSKSTSITSENIQVMVRCRPPSDMEVKTHEQDCWTLTPEQGSIQLNESDGLVFEYDKVFRGSNNADIYESGIQKLVRSTMEGYNGTVFAYGQTASGKTYTMTGTSEEPGVIPKAVQDVFAYIEEEAVDREFLLQVSYMEIYNEKINDLLQAKPTTSSLLIRTANGQDYVEGLTSVAVTNPDEVMAFIKLGEGRRHTSETDFNQNSSRSHTIFQLVIESKSRTSSLASVRTSRLNLIDLAGSEKVATNTERRQEGSFINRSLLTLGMVITHLNSGAKHIPYRDSKLTRILSASLSGNDRVAVICTINPAWKSKDESTNTLRFAQGVKKIEINPKITQVTQHSRLQNYKEQIMDLENQMQKKTEQEAETKERLSHLLSLILTSSKTPVATMNNLDEVATDGTLGDFVNQCEEHLSATIYKHQDEINRKEQDLRQLDDRLSQSQQNLEEKTIVIDELQGAIQDYQRINDELQWQLNKYRDNFAQVNKRWNGLESSINDYKERLIASEGKVALLESQRQADDHIRQLMEQQLDECKAELEQKMHDDDLFGMVQSLHDEPEETAGNDDNDHRFDGVDEQRGAEKEKLKDLDSTLDENDDGSRLCHNEELRINQKLLEGMKKQLNDTKMEYDRQIQNHKNELDKEREHGVVYRRKIDQIQIKLYEVEAALKQAKVDEMEHTLKEATLNQTISILERSTKARPTLSTTTLPPLTSLSSTTTTTSSNHLITQHLYLDQNTLVLLLSFGLWLFL